jgi:hypothetical protein
MKSKKLLMVFSVMFLVLLFTSCGTGTKIIATWQNKEVHIGKIHKILLVGIAKDPWVRKMFEAKLKEEFLDVGVDAVSSLEIVSPDIKLTKENYELYFGNKNFDAVLVTRVVAEKIDKERIYNYTPTYGVYGAYGFYGYYAYAYDYMNTPGYLVETKSVNLETNVFDVKTGTMLWSTISESFDVTKASEVINPLVGLIVDKLKEDGLID